MRWIFFFCGVRAFCLYAWVSRCLRERQERQLSAGGRGGWGCKILIWIWFFFGGVSPARAPTPTRPRRLPARLPARCLPIHAYTYARFFLCWFAVLLDLFYFFFVFCFCFFFCLVFFLSFCTFLRPFHAPLLFTPILIPTHPSPCSPPSIHPSTSPYPPHHACHATMSPTLHARMPCMLHSRTTAHFIL